MSREDAPTQAPTGTSRLRTLLAQREVLEIEAESIGAELNSPGPNGEPPVGLKGNLVDSEGYPRAEVDVYRVRAQRNRLAVINTDYKLIMKEIETELHLVHHSAPAFVSSSSSSSSSSSVSSSSSSSSSSISSSKAETLHFASSQVGKRASYDDVPIAIIDEILEGSPADSAGLQDGDELLQFGAVTASSIADAISAIPAVVRDNVNKPIAILVRRQGAQEPLSLTLTPTSWGGRGLLGFHLTPKR